MRSLGNFTHIISLPRTVFTAISAQIKNLEDHAVAATTQPADILAFEVTSLKFTHAAICVLTNPYTATIGYFSSLDMFLTTTGTHTNFIKL